MSRIGDAMDGLLAELVGAGLAATNDPSLVPNLVAEHGYAIALEPPTVPRMTLAGSLVLEVPVRVAVAPPGGLLEYEAAWTALETLPGLLGAAEATREALNYGDVSFPGYLVTVTTRTNL